MKTFLDSLIVKPVQSFERLPFDLLNFCFFRNSDGGNVLYFGNPRLLSLFAIMFYILAIEILNFRGRRYFIRFKKQIVGIFALREKTGALYISSLAVNPHYRRLGIGAHMLSYSEKLAKRMNKQWLELSVLKANISALLLYRKWGFTRREEKNRTYILSKKL